MSQDPKNITHLLGARKLSRILRKSEKIIQINALIKELLPKEMTQNVRVMNIYQDTLILAVTSSAWITRLKFASRDLLNNLHYYDAFSQLKNIQYKVVPERGEKKYQRESAPSAKLSAAGRKTISESASNMRDPALRAALQRLARDK